MEKQIEQELKKLIATQAREKWQVRIKKLFSFKESYYQKQPFNDWGIATDTMPDIVKIKQASMTLGRPSMEVSFLSKSKLGLLSYKAVSQVGAYRCLDCSKEELAGKIEEIILHLRSNGLDFIPFEKKVKEMLFFKWIEGREVELKDFLTPGFLENIVQMQASLHKCPLSQALQDRYNTKESSQYLDFLGNRLGYFANKYFLQDFNAAELVEKTLRSGSINLTLSITQPDFTDNNLVIDQNNKVWLVDVETLNIDYGYEFDILNTARFLFAKSKFFQSQYYTLYKKYHSLGGLEQNRVFWENVWLIRLTGSALQAGKIEQGKKYLDILKDNLQNGAN